MLVKTTLDTKRSLFNTAKMSISEDGKAWSELLIVIFGVFSTVVYPLLAQDRRKRWNIQFKKRASEVLYDRFGWDIRAKLSKNSASSPAKAIDDENGVEDDKTWRILPGVFSVLLLGSVISLILDGNIDLAINVSIASFLYTLCVIYMPKKWFNMIVLMLSCHHFLTVWVKQDFYIQTGSIKRVMLGKALLSLLLMENIDEMALQVLAYDLVVLNHPDTSPSFMFQGGKIFLFAILPVSLVDFQDFVRSSWMFTLDSKHWGAQVQFFLGVLVTITTVLLTLSGSGPHEDKKHNSRSGFALLTGTLHLVLLAASSLFPQVVDYQLGDPSEWHMMANMDNTGLETGDEFFNVLNLVLFCSLVLGFVFFQPTLIVVTLILGAAGRVYPEGRRIPIMASHLVTFVFLLLGAKSTSTFTLAERFSLMVLSTVRVALAFERRPISAVLRETALFTVITMAIVKDNSLIPSLSFLALVSSVVAIVVAHSRLHAVRVLIRERHSHAFLSHAIKQKYSGVGGALEALLGDAKFLESMAFDVERLLRGALEECRQGERLCHTVNLVARIRQHSHVSSCTWNSLQNVLNKWQHTGELMLTGSVDSAVVVSQQAGDSKGRENIQLRMDWDLFRVSLCTWAHGAEKLLVKTGLCPESELASLVGKEGDDVHPGHWRRVTIERVNPSYGLFKDENGPVSVLLEAMKGKFEGKHTIVVDCEARRARMGSTEDESAGSTRRPSNSPVEPPSGDDTWRIVGEEDHSHQNMQGTNSASERELIDPAAALPSGLVFAILDDNALVKKNVERVCKVYLRADGERSFSMGDNISDCKTFIQRIVENRVDVAIIDENLEYDESRISGTALARQARKKGFTGTLILHSANSPNQVLDTCFDAFLEKTANRRAIVRGISEAVLNHICGNN